MLRDTPHKEWFTIQIKRFVSVTELSNYFQDNVAWDLDHKFIDTFGSCNTNVYIQDSEEALLFKLKFKL